jgi:trans-aconitate methyltransferase
MTQFITAKDSHRHSLETLNQLQEYDEFMESIQTVVDLGCGAGLDLEWWATRTTREDFPKPLNIQCTGVDIHTELPIAKAYTNITYQRTDFEETIYPPKKINLMFYGRITRFSLLLIQFKP